MIIEIDFNSEEALYLQLCNQIIMGIATSRFREGDPLPSVRQLADSIGINMHTVNKAYTVLKQEGYVKVDRRRGAVIAIDVDRMETLEALKKELQVILAKGSCKNISKEEIHGLRITGNRLKNKAMHSSQGMKRGVIWVHSLQTGRRRHWLTRPNLPAA